MKELETQVDTNENNIALMQKDLTYMREGIDDIKEGLKDLREEVVNGFVNKDQFSSLSDRVGKIENLKDWGVKIVIGAIVLSLLAIIGVRQ